MIEREDTEVWLVYHWNDLLAVVNSEQKADGLCCGAVDHMTWKRFVLSDEEDV
jgi:hypothetical protein